MQLLIKISFAAAAAMLAFWAVAGLVVPGPCRTSDAKLHAARIQIAAFHTGVDALQADIGRLPATHEQLASLLEAPAGATNWQGPYFREIPLDPWGRSYLYRPQPERGTNAYQILSAGPDGRFGTEDDITAPKGWTIGMAVKP